jgi:ABC-2 type transport system ATP-binding protein
MITDTVITTQNLSKNYGKFRAVSNLTLRVPQGSISGILGQNGAGKSTTIKMLLGMVHPSSGTGEVLGIPIDDDRVAHVPEDKRLYDYMTVAQMIGFTRQFFPNWRTDLEQRLLEEFQLPQPEDGQTLEGHAHTDRSPAWHLPWLRGVSP